jgi:hypothetical protein
MFHKKEKPALPRTVDEVADLLISDLMTMDIEHMSRLETEEFMLLYREVAAILLDEFKIWTGNDALLRSCIEEIGKVADAGLDPAYIILKRVCEKLQEAETGVFIIT